MKNKSLQIELLFERLTLVVTKVLGSYFAFVLALTLVLFWWSTNLFTSNNWHQNIGDIIFGFTFLSLFIIQKSFNRYSALIHLKMNELISSHERAKNAVMNTGNKTEKEIRELSEEYIESDATFEKEVNIALNDVNTENQV
ncbi:Low affinity Fe/Cu permease [Flavobacterium succinicans]|jgi:low affinity Fe/Cu permease|uniref:Low affinity Fe/Cu permease n=1 Tax=Flavobacterium succinicans TaxID=29536 RepID=A0A1I4YLY9_9FLAO|nr:low affinity iron permease family protein [Flavobacterium succinicans]SFN38589.1 Low affinity Fe/Cu permease [Flavobacterium succinicans]